MPLWIPRKVPPYGTAQCDRARAAGLPAEREAELLAVWKEHAAHPKEGR